MYGKDMQASNWHQPYNATITMFTTPIADAILNDSCEDEAGVQQDGGSVVALALQPAALRDKLLLMSVALRFSMRLKV